MLLNEERKCIFFHKVGKKLNLNISGLGIISGCVEKCRLNSPRGVLGECRHWAGFPAFSFCEDQVSGSETGGGGWWGCGMVGGGVASCD